MIRENLNINRNRKVLLLLTSVFTVTFFYYSLSVISEQLFLLRRDFKLCYTPYSFDVEIKAIPAQQLTMKNINISYHNTIQKKISDVTIHIAFISAGTENFRNLRIATQTLLMKTKSFVTFHLIGDVENYNYMKNLLAHCSKQNIKFYDWKQYEYLIEFIPNTHYSGIFTLLKLLLPEILPFTIDRVIVMDTDMIFNRNVKLLWELFREFDENNLVGIAGEQSSWYLERSNKWLANNLGYNSGVMLMDLTRLREIQWYTFWKAEVSSNLLKYHMLELADQDVINSVAYEYPHLFYEIPCHWNKQWRPNNKYCQKHVFPNGEVSALHFNGKIKDIYNTALPKYIWDLLGKTLDDNFVIVN